MDQTLEMSRELSILAVIPARAGSQGVKRKNIIDLGGVPLIAHTLKAAKESTLISKTICSTDSEEIRSIVQQLGGEVPFLRPVALGTGESPVLETLQHAVRFEEQREFQPDVIVLLQPTSPFRSGLHIDKAVTTLIESDFDSVISVAEVKEHPYWMKTLEHGQLKPFLQTNGKEQWPRQKLPKLYIPNGAIYVTRYDTLMVQNTIVGKNCGAFVMSREVSIDIDDEFDLTLARHLAGQVDLIGKPR